MAMIKCENCNKDISDKSNTCIYCGVSVEISKLNNNYIEKKKKKRKNNTNVIVIIEIGIIVFIVFLYINLFGKRISNYIDTNHDKKLEEMCTENYSGVWNKEKGVCETDAAEIELK